MNTSADLLALKRDIAPGWLARAQRAGVTAMRWTHRIGDAADRAGHAVHAIGLGAKRVAGHATTTPALQMYVVQKLPRRLLAARDCIPSSIDGLAVDVVEAPPAFMAADHPERRACEPMCAGVSVGRKGVTFGTLGAFCRSRKPEEADRILMLSNRHVLAGHDGKSGDPVYQPGPGDTSAALRQVGTLLRFWPVEPGIIANRVDAAVAEVSGAGHAVTLLPGDAPRIMGATRARDNVIVCKFGRTSGFTEGFISNLSCNIVVGVDPGRPGVSATFIDQIRIDRRPGSPIFADAGDSGSAILEKGTGQVVGLYFAGPLDGTYGIANHIGDVTDFLQIDLLT